MDNKVIYSGAGSGKTYRDIFVEILESGTDIGNIQVKAFNRSVVNEITFRIEKATVESADELGKTIVPKFHGFCRRPPSTEFEIKVFPSEKKADEFMKLLEDTRKFTKKGCEKEILTKNYRYDTKYTQTLAQRINRMEIQKNLQIKLQRLLNTRDIQRRKLRKKYKYFRRTIIII